MKSKTTHHLAQINIAKLIAPLEDPLIKEFRESIDFVNQVGSESPGFLWIYKADDGSSSSYEENLYEDPLIVVNYTLWENYESLHHFVFNTVHSYFLKNRKRWFSKLEQPHVAMWWVPAGTIPTIEDAKEKLAQLEKNGPGPEVFTMRKRYSATGEVVV